MRKKILCSVLLSTLLLLPTGVFAVEQQGAEDGAMEQHQATEELLPSEKDVATEASKPAKAKAPGHGSKENTRRSENGTEGNHSSEENKAKPNGKNYSETNKAKSNGKTDGQKNSFQGLAARALKGMKAGALHRILEYRHSVSAQTDLRPIRHRSVQASATIRSNRNVEHITITMSLQKYSEGKWVKEKKWKARAENRFFSLIKTQKVTKGKYRVYTVFHIFTNDDKEKIIKESRTVRIK